ncbi:uridylate-specific endoribonuclease isoform X1 [Ranitomeya imitator]|uniref:uridylate-specific endoribonuclease isoform X1 n=1 Tax=Ranitomeya imitator TaxID=111125 RepID=UPI0037E8395C
MKTLLIALLLHGIVVLHAFDTCSSHRCEHSCKNRCGDKLDKSYSCQCNVHCERFGDCCDDYSICSYIDPHLNEVTHDDGPDTDYKLHKTDKNNDKSDTSCQGRCGGRFNKKDPCHCNRKCEKFENCCSDYNKVCGGGASNKVVGGNSESKHQTDTDSKLHKTDKNNDKSDTSCQGRCGGRFNKKDPCHCNRKCEKFENCCNDYNKVCGGGASNKVVGGNCESKHQTGNDISKDEIKALSEILYKADVNKAAESDITLHKQEMSQNTKEKEDLCDKPLYQFVNENIFERPTYKAFIALLDNYNRKTGTDETFTEKEIEEQDIFFQEIMKTNVMKELFTFFHKKGMYSKEQEFVDDLKKMWFGLYSRSSGEQDSCGFEHVFVGEVKKGKVSGFHSWICFYLLEKKGMINYHSHNYDGPWTNYPDVLGKQFNWEGFHKEVGTQIIGSSPEFDFAVYSLCFISRPGKKCTISMGGHEIAIQTYEWTKTSYNNGKKYIATAYATF